MTWNVGLKDFRVLMGFCLPSMPSSGTSTIRTRASGRHTTGTTTTGATPGALREARAHSSQCLLGPWRPPTGFLHQRPPWPPRLLPAGPVVLGNGVPEGCLPSEELLYPHRARIFVSGFKQTTVTFLSSICPPPPVPFLLFEDSPLPWSEAETLVAQGRMPSWPLGPALPAPQLPRLSCSWL